MGSPRSEVRSPHEQTLLAVDGKPQKQTAKKRAGKLPWPKTLAERVKAVTAAQLAKRFARAKGPDVGEILETLCALGKAGHGNTDDTPASAGPRFK